MFFPLKIKKNTSSQELPKSDSQEKKKEEKKAEVAKKNPLKVINKRLYYQKTSSYND